MKKKEFESIWAFRLGVFNDNAAMIDRHNAEADKGLHSYRLKINQFADMVSK